MSADHTSPGPATKGLQIGMLDSKKPDLNRGHLTIGNPRRGVILALLQFLPPSSPAFQERGFVVTPNLPGGRAERDPLARLPRGPLVVDDVGERYDQRPANTDSHDTSA